MKNRLKQIIVWCMVAALLCVNCSFTSEAKTGSKVTVPKTSITSVRSRSAGQVTVRFKKSKKAGSYQIQISTDKKFKKGVKSQKVSAGKKTVTFKKLKQGKKYYVRVRVYRTVKKKKYHSAWSKVKSVKVKKKTTKKDSGQKNTGDSNKSENTTDVTDTTENTGAAKDTDTTGNTNSVGHFLRTVQYMPVCFAPCSCVCSRLISPSVSSWHKQDNTSICQSGEHIQHRTPYNS